MNPIEDIVLTWNEAGKLAQTCNFLATNPAWQELTGFLQLVGKVNDVVLDWHSEYAQTNGLNGNLGAYVVTTENTTLYIYYLAYLQSSIPTARLLHTYSMADATVVTSARVDCSKSETGFVAVAWKDRTGTHLGRSTDGGEIWGAAYAVGATIIDSVTNDNAQIGMVIDGDRLIVTAPNSNQEYGLYHGTASGTLVELAGTPRSSTPQATIVPDRAGRLYVSTPADQGTDHYTVTFDAGGHSNYTTGSGGSGTLTTAASGNPGNAIGWSHSGANDDFSYGDMSLQTYFPYINPGTYLTSCSFDVWVNWTGVVPPSGTNVRIWIKLYDAGYGQLEGYYADLNGSTTGTATNITVYNGTGNYTGDYRGAWHTITLDFSANPHLIGGYLELRYQSVYHSFQNPEIRFDNIRFTFDPPVGGTPKVYRVDTYTGTPTWVDITPAGSFIPRTPYGVSVNAADIQTIDILGKDSSHNWKHFTSEDRGSTWTDQGTTNNQDLWRAGNTLVATGTNTIERSPDGGDTFLSKVGNLGTVLGGSPGILRGAATQLFEQSSVGFRMDIVEGYAPLTVQFTDQSVGTINSYAWDFGDSATSTQANPTHSFVTPGYYTVELTITRPGGGTQQTARRITVLDSETDAVPLPECENKWLCLIGSFVREVMSPHSVILLDGEKREEVTDLQVQTPAGTLALTRYYRQNQQPANGSTPPFDNFKLLGLGWTHNHHANLVRTAGTPNRITVLIGEADVHYLESAPGSHTYQAVAGATSTLTYDPVQKTYTLLTSDQTELVFSPPDPNTNTDIAQLTRRTWSNGEQWDYSYSGVQLTEVSDGYGRKLVFRYYTTGSYIGRLYRVGDHTFDDTTPGNLAGHYVEYQYVSNKINSGGIVDGSESLLNMVQDVRGNSWQYHYYGQQTGETEVNQLNYLVRYTAPTVDGAIIDLKKINYTLSGSTVAQIQEELGVLGTQPALQTTQFEFGLSGTSATTHITRETTASVSAQHLFADEVYAGTRNGLQHYAPQRLEPSYRPGSQKDANGQITRLNWDIHGQQLQGVTDALHQPTDFRYDGENRLILSADAEERKTVYLYTSVAAPRQPTVIQVWDKNGMAVQRWQEFTYDLKGRTLTETLLDPANGTTVLQQTTRTYATSGNGYGLLATVTHEDVLQPANNQTTTYFYDVAGRVQQVNQSAALGSCEKSFTLYDAAGNVIASICHYENTGAAPTTVAQCVALFNASLPDQNQVTTHEYDPLGRRIKTTTNAGASYAQTSLTLYDALSRVTRTIGNYVAQGSSAPGNWVWEAGIWKQGASGTAISHGAEQNQNLISDTVYNQRGLVRLRRDVLGNVTLYGYDNADRLVKTVQNAANPDYNNDYSGTGADPDLSDYTAGSAVDQDFITEQAYDANGNLVMSQDVRGMKTFTVYDALNRPVKTVANAKTTATLALNPGDSGYDATLDPRSASYTLSTAPDRDFSTQTEYDALGRVIRTRRLLENRDTPAQWDVTLYGYDALGRQVRVIQHASQPEYNVGNDPDLDQYSLSSATDLDQLTRTEYDAAGRVRHSIDVNGQLTRSVYDGLGRGVKTIANYVAQGSSDPANWVWDTGDARWEDGAGNPISHGDNFDQNVITATAYDADGRVDFTQNFQGLLGKSGYDDRGRTVINVQNFVDNSYAPLSSWVYESGVWQDEPGGATIARGSGYDQNVISGTEYDAQSRVLETRDVRGNVTRFVYDTVGRRVRTITHYVAQGSSDPADWVFEAGVWKQSASGTVVSHAADNTQNLISDTVYDVAGRVVSTRDAVGRVSRTVYDLAGRTTLRVMNYTAASDPAWWVWDSNQQRWEDGSGNPLSFGSAFDQNHVSLTEYNSAGQVVATRDTRGTRTTFGYDAAGRRLTVTAAQGSGLDTTSYTGYDKAGRVRRTIQRYIPQEGVSPDTRTNGQWDFQPLEHGSYNDENLITEFTYDAASRRTQVTSPAGSVSQTSYFKDGQVNSQTDPLGVVTVYRYDQLRRRVRVVQSYIAQGSSDPAHWVFESGVWKQAASGTSISHGANSDQNIIVTLKHDAAGQMAEMRDPRGNITTYAYDKLGRRTSATNPLSQAWLTAFADVGQTTRTTQTYPHGYSVQRDFDPLGRLANIQYGSPTTTPDVQFTYDLVGSRAKMSEFGGANFTSKVRETTYSYDAAQRLTSVGYDTDGNGTIEETVAYEYDAGGLRTKLTMPGNLSITYEYDRKGRLITATDWDDQRHTFSYDGVDRHASTRRPHRLISQYRYDVGGRLRQLRHHQHGKLLGQFDYTVDARGNRTQVKEVVRQPGSGTTTTTHTPNFVTTDRWGQVDLEIVGYEATITYGTAANGSYFDVYVNDTLWESFDGYATSAGEKSVVLRLTEEGRHRLSFRNRHDHAPSSTGYRMEIKTVAVTANNYSAHTVNYTYDQLARLIAAVSDQRSYGYQYDVAGNRLQEQVTIGITTTTTDYTYNAANQIATQKIGSNPTTNFSYDNNGNLLSDGVLAYTWNRANRLTTVNSGSYNTHYAYDGDNNRHSQTVGGIVTRYLLDTQPGLALVIGTTTGTDTTRYIHSLRGIHTIEDSAGNWHVPLQDGLGSVRNQVDGVGIVEASQDYAPYGQPFNVEGTFSSEFGFAGEQITDDGLSYNRARYYNAGIGAWTGLDTLETDNRYVYVGGNVPNATDPRGLEEVATFCSSNRELCTALVAAFSDTTAVVGSVGSALSAIAFPIASGGIVTFGGAAITASAASSLETQIGNYMNSIANLYSQSLVQSLIRESQQAQVAEEADQQAEITQAFANYLQQAEMNQAFVDYFTTSHTNGVQQEGVNTLGQVGSLALFWPVYLQNTCVEGLQGILSALTGTQTTTTLMASTIPPQLRQQAYRLSRECRRGDGTACDTLLNMCNQAQLNGDPFRKELCKLRSQCHDWVLTGFQAMKDATCKTGKKTCIAGDSLDTMIAKITRNALCIAVRTGEGVACFGGKLDFTHEDAVREATKPLGDCITLYGQAGYPMEKIIRIIGEVFK